MSTKLRKQKDNAPSANEKESRAVANTVQSNDYPKQVSGLIDNRPGVTAQMKLQESESKKSPAVLNSTTEITLPLNTATPLQLNKKKRRAQAQEQRRYQSQPRNLVSSYKYHEAQGNKYWDNWDLAKSKSHYTSARNLRRALKKIKGGWGDSGHDNAIAWLQNRIDRLNQLINAN